MEVGQAGGKLHMGCILHAEIGPIKKIERIERGLDNGIPLHKRLEMEADQETISYLKLLRTCRNTVGWNERCAKVYPYDGREISGLAQFMETFPDVDGLFLFFFQNILLLFFFSSTLNNVALTLSKCWNVGFQASSQEFPRHFDPAGRCRWMAHHTSFELVVRRSRMDDTLLVRSPSQVGCGRGGHQA